MSAKAVIWVDPTVNLTNSLSRTLRGRLIWLTGSWNSFAGKQLLGPVLGEPIRCLDASDMFSEFEGMFSGPKHRPVCHIKSPKCTSCQLQALEFFESLGAVQSFMPQLTRRPLVFQNSKGPHSLLFGAEAPPKPDGGSFSGCGAGASGARPWETPKCSRIAGHAKAAGFLVRFCHLDQENACHLTSFI